MRTPLASVFAALVRPHLPAAAALVILGASAQPQTTTPTATPATSQSAWTKLTTEPHRGK